MPDSVLLEIVIAAIPLEQRHAIEATLDDALDVDRLGEVTGGGTGASSSTIDVDMTNASAALVVIRRVLAAHELQVLAVNRRA